ncbi:small acidic protein-like [Mercenaria mercenaria]|uniref:small acidic protein-like n=1 Tax=Mercenaria mercenaria TaxID=6596 RepID=UPI00234E376F|nr:small acidic protein-like [Mercenaria mercenaria]
MSTSDESREKKNNEAKSEKEDVVPAKVHSANSWETADLGDEDRNKKFLRLMGAAKSEHQGRFIIGEKDMPAHKHSRDKKQTEEIEQELEDQYKHTFEHRITKWSHKGLGFDDEKKEVTTESSQSGDSKQDSENSSVSDSKSEDQSGKKRESSEPAKNPEVPPKKPKMMMNFVKASD